MRKLHSHQQTVVLVAPGQNSVCSEHQPFRALLPNLHPAINKRYLETNLTGNTRCALFRELVKSEPEDGPGHWFGVFGCRITQERCKQEHPGAVPHPPQELGVGNLTDSVISWEQFISAWDSYSALSTRAYKWPSTGVPLALLQAMGFTGRVIWKDSNQGFLWWFWGETAEDCPHFSKGQKCPVPWWSWLHP